MEVVMWMLFGISFWIIGSLIFKTLCNYFSDKLLWFLADNIKGIKDDGVYDPCLRIDCKNERYTKYACDEVAVLRDRVYDLENKRKPKTKKKKKGKK